jgi:predicted nucleotidyltransferase component of viral defense system
MKDHLRDLVDRQGGDTLQKLCIAREYLQARILQSLQEDGAFTRWAFQGGTALRFLYAMPRFSEDLNFAVAQPGVEVAVDSAVRRVESSLASEGYTLSVKPKTDKTVATAFVRFAGLPYELGLSPHADQVLSVRVEVDTNPPEGANLDTTIVRRHILLHLQHYDRASLLAGKLHAVLSRPWCKGRDLFDLAWYLADRDWPEPNIPFLNAALRQTEWTGPIVSLSAWRSVTAERLKKIDWHQAREDARPFLERPQDVEMITSENLMRLLMGDRGDAAPGAEEPHVG